MKYLITGITGFAGPHLANLLIQNNRKVSGLVRRSNGMETDILDVVPKSHYKEIDFLYCDLLNKESLGSILKANKFDGIFHLAAQSHPPTSFVDPLGTFQTNVIGSVNLIESIIEHSPDTKLMFCSTSEVYGNVGADKRILMEDDRIQPSNPYGNSKAAIDLYLQERFTNGKLKRGFITRAFSHTGPRRGKIFSISSDAFQLASLPLSGGILKVGNLQTTRVVLDVRDVVRAYLTLMTNEETNGQIYNVCGDTPRKMEFFTDTLIEISTKKVTKEIEPKFYRPHDIFYQHGNSDKLKKLGWYPKISIKETLYDLYDYWTRKLEN